jgi:hypothetical protein
MTREFGRTFKPVRILVAGKYKTVHTVVGAARALLDIPPSEAEHRATMAVLRNFNDGVSPQDVRDKLIAAAFEAKMDVRF